MDIKYSIRDKRPVRVDEEMVNRLISLVAEIANQNKLAALTASGFSEAQLADVDTNHLDIRYARRQVEMAGGHFAEAKYSDGKSVKLPDANGLIDVLKAESGTLEEIILGSDRGDFNIRVSLGGKYNPTISADVSGSPEIVIYRDKIQSIIENSRPSYEFLYNETNRGLVSFFVSGFIVFLSIYKYHNILYGIKINENLLLIISFSMGVLFIGLNYSAIRLTDKAYRRLQFAFGEGHRLAEQRRIINWICGIIIIPILLSLVFS